MDDSILEKNRSDWSSFAQEDAFNSGNYVEGHISRHSGDDYGALYIQKVNGIKCSQLIYCTPKIQYPFDSTGHWHWPKAKIIERYEKLDGTNIFAYKYVDSKGGEFLSYKTRLLPFIGNSRFGPFLDMWNEILKTNSKIVRLCKYSRENFSFELWGARNPHLVKYEVPLKASLLFARSGQKIIPCNHIVQTINPDLYDCASFRGNVDRDYIWNYQESQKNLEASLKEVEDGYMGQEGEVWYLQDESGQWIMFKCKPETIEQIHWSAGGIGKNIIKATIENAFENWDCPTVDQIKGLLKEEFSESEIEKIHYSIIKHLDEAIKNHEFALSVLREYRSLGLSILENKSGVMRALSSKFNRGEITKVFSVIWNSEIK